MSGEYAQSPSYPHCILFTISNILTSEIIGENMERDHQTTENAMIPEPLPVNFDNIPERLRPYSHFVVWQYEQIEDELKKPPFDPKTGKRASVRRPDTWGSFHDAQAAYETGQFAGRSKDFPPPYLAKTYCIPPTCFIIPFNSIIINVELTIVVANPDPRIKSSTWQGS
jgi:hypothetical protein